MGNVKFIEFSVGWLKQSEKKGEYISANLAKGNPAKGKPGVTKMTVELDNGETIDVSNFLVYFNDNKISEKAPDVQFVLVQEQ